MSIGQKKEKRGFLAFGKQGKTRADERGVGEEGERKKGEYKGGKSPGEEGGGGKWRMHL